MAPSSSPCAVSGAARTFVSPKARRTRAAIRSSGAPPGSSRSTAGRTVSARGAPGRVGMSVASRIGAPGRRRTTTRWSASVPGPSSPMIASTIASGETAREKPWRIRAKFSTSSRVPASCCSTLRRAKAAAPATAATARRREGRAGATAGRSRRRRGRRGRRSPRRERSRRAGRARRADRGAMKRAAAGRWPGSGRSRREQDAARGRRASTRRRGVRQRGGLAGTSP